MKEELNVLIIGAGNRGMYVYAELSKRKDIPIKVSGVAESDPEKLEKMRNLYNIPEELCFKSGKDALLQKRDFDAVIIASPDYTHYELTLMSLNNGYHVLLEKPMSHSPKQCIEIVKAQEKSGKVLSLAHVLRYAPFFQEIKKMIDEKTLGEVQTIDLLEEVGYWHFAHSYVRGNWSKESESGPIILTKSCHDLDILNYLIESDIETVYSTGSLNYFKINNSPPKSTKTCIEKCSVKNTCPYNAERFYLFEKDPLKVGYPANVISLEKTIESRKKALKNGPYGKCVFKCNNDVCDNQVVVLNFKNKVRVNFRISAFGQEPIRKIKIYFGNGEINGNLTEGSIRITKYGGTKDKDTLKQEYTNFFGGHGGGDFFLLKNFVQLILGENKKLNLSSAQLSLDSHLLAFAAEKSRKENIIIDYENYKKEILLL